MTQNRKLPKYNGRILYAGIIKMGDHDTPRYLGAIPRLDVHRDRAIEMKVHPSFDDVYAEQVIHRHIKNPKWIMYMIFTRHIGRAPRPPWHLFRDGVEWICNGVTNLDYEEDAKRIRKAHKE